MNNTKKTESKTITVKEKKFNEAKTFLNKEKNNLQLFDCQFAFNLDFVRKNEITKENIEKILKFLYVCTEVNKKIVLYSTKHFMNYVCSFRNYLKNEKFTEFTENSESILNFKKIVEIKKKHFQKIESEKNVLSNENKHNLYFASTKQTFIRNFIELKFIKNNEIFNLISENYNVKHFIIDYNNVIKKLVDNILIMNELNKNKFIYYTQLKVNTELVNKYKLNYNISEKEFKKKTNFNILQKEIHKRISNFNKKNKYVISDFDTFYKELQKSMNVKIIDFDVFQNEFKK